MLQCEMWTLRSTWMKYDGRIELGIGLENMIPMTEKILGDEDMTGIVLLGDRDIVLMISNTNEEI
jgi:hypothetical protein